MKRVLACAAAAVLSMMLMAGCSSAQIALSGTASAEQVSMGFPEGFAASGTGEPNQTFAMTPEGEQFAYGHASVSIANEDYTVAVSLDQYDGVTLEQVRAYCEEQASITPDQLQGMLQSDGFQQFADTWRLDESWYEHAGEAVSFGAPESVSLDGRDGFCVTTTWNLSFATEGDAVASTNRTYWIPVDDDSVGSVSVMGSDADLEANREVIDAMLASVKVS